MSIIGLSGFLVGLRRIFLILSDQFRLFAEKLRAFLPAFRPRTEADREAFLFTEAADTEFSVPNEQRYERGVLVGTLRTAEQLQYSMDTLRYFTPARFITEDLSSVRYIALYEEGIGTEPGIRLYGEVAAIQTVPRKTIPVAMRPETDPAELYHEFTVKEWTTLPCPIHIMDTYRGRPRFTSLFLLRHSTRSYQLFEIRSDEDHRLMHLLNRGVEAMLFADDPAHCAEYDIAGSHRLEFRKGQILLRRSGGMILDLFPADWMLRHPRAGYVRLKRTLAEEAKELSHETEDAHVSE